MIALAATLDRNLRALNHYNPTGAALLAATLNPSDWIPTQGTDRTLTYSRPRPPQHIDWLGGTSMPAASALPITANLAAGHSNGLGLSMGTGYEWVAFAARLSNPQMLFILEPDAATARLAFSICDLSSLLESGKLIPLIGPAAGDQLLEVLQQHSGIDPPIVIHPPPTLDTALRHAMISLGEQMIRRAVPIRAQQTADRLSTLADYTPAPSRSVLAVSIRAQHYWDRPAHALGAGCPTLDLSDHRQTSRLHRINLIERHRPTEIFADLSRAQLGPEIPPQVPVIFRVPPSAAPAFWQDLKKLPAGGLSSVDRALCHSAQHVRQLKLSGVPESQITLMPLGIVPPTSKEKLPAIAPRSAVALIGDFPAIDSETYGLNLPTHAAVWNAAAELMFEDPLAVHEGAIADLLRRAQARAGVVLKEPEILEPLARGLWLVLGRTVPNLAIAAQLAQANISLKLIGNGWSHPALSTAIPRVAFPATSVAAEEIWQDVAVAVNLSAAGIVDPAILHAAICNVVIVSPEHPLDSAAGSLATMLRESEHFIRPARRQLLPAIKSLLRDGAKRQSLADAARRQLIAHHVWPMRAVGSVIEKSRVLRE